MSDLDYDSSTVEKVLKNFRSWCFNGRDMPGYEMGNGIPYICRLLGYDYNLHQGSLIHKIHREHPLLFKSLAGPNGWAYLKILIAQMQERELPHKVRKAKQKAWRKNRKLEECNETDTSL